MRKLNPRLIPFLGMWITVIIIAIREPSLGAVLVFFAYLTSLIDF